MSQVIRVALAAKLEHYGQLLHLGNLAVMESIQFTRRSLWISNLNGKPMDPHFASDGTWYMILFRLQTSLADSSFIDSSHCQGQWRWVHLSRVKESQAVHPHRPVAILPSTLRVREGVIVKHLGGKMWKGHIHPQKKLTCGRGYSFWKPCLWCSMLKFGACMKIRWLSGLCFVLSRCGY